MSIDSAQKRKGGRTPCPTDMLCCALLCFRAARPGVPPKTGYPSNCRDAERASVPHQGGELEDRQPVVALRADAQQAHDVGMPQRVEQVDLDAELAVALHPPPVQLLHRDRLAVPQDAPVHLRPQACPVGI